MKNKCERIFSLTPEECIVIPNGIDFEEFAEAPFDWDFRRKYALEVKR